MAAFFKNPAPPGRDAARIHECPRLARVWRVGADGRPVSVWKAETADVLPFKTPTRLQQRMPSVSTAVAVGQ